MLKLFIFIFIFSGCLLQQPTPISSENRIRQNNNSQCDGANLKTDLADKQNTIKIFNCIGWNNEFPALYNLVLNLPEKQYQSVSNLLNTVFFKSKEDKDKFFELLTKYGKQDNFKSFRNLLLNALSPQILNTVKGILSDLESENDLLWINLIEDKHLNRLMIDNLFELKKNFTLSEKDIFKYSKVFHSNVYQKLQNNLLDNALNDLSSVEGLKALSEFSYYEGWPYSWMQQLNKSDFEKLFFYVGSFDKSTLEDTRYLRNHIFKKVVCDEYSGRYVFDHGKELRLRVQNIVDMNINQFYADYIDLLQSFSLFKNVCNQTAKTDENVKKIINTTDALFKIAHQTFSMHGGFELIKNIVRVTLTDELESSGAMMELMHSKSFIAYIDLVKHLEKSELSKEYFSLWISILKNFMPSSLKKSSILLNEFSTRDQLVKSFHQVWVTLSNKSKSDLRVSLINLMLKLDDQSINLNFLNETLSTFPDALDLKIFNLEQKDIIELGLYLVRELARPSIQKELSLFLTQESFFQLVRLMGSIETEDVATVPIVTSPHTTYVLDANEDLESCFLWLGSKLENGVNFWDLLDRYPQKCERNVGNYLSTHVLNWTILIDQTFMAQTGRKFSVAYGVIAPEMMEYYLDLVLIINKYLEKNDGYLKDVVINIQKHLFDYKLIDVLESSLQIANKINEKTKLASQLLFNFSIRDADVDINIEKDLKSYLISYLEIDDSRKFPKLDPICLSLDSLTLKIRCLDSETLGNYFDKLSKQLLAKNWADQDPLQLMLAMFYPQKGLNIPYNRRYIKKFHMTLDQLVRFLYDVSDPTTLSDITYYTEEANYQVKTTIVERVEILIREIAFLDNFYGAFFMNTVAKAKNYQKKVKSLKRQMKLLYSMSNSMRSLGVLPRETRWMLPNTLNTYDSLLEVVQSFDQPEGDKISHQDFIQALMVMVVESTNSQANSFTAFRIPKPYLVKDHRGKIITMSTELSLLTRGAKLLRRFYPKKEELVLSKNFQQVSQILPNLMSYDTLYDLSKYLLSSSNTKLLLQDFANFSDKIEPFETKFLLELSGSFIRLNTDCQNCYDSYSSLIKKFIDNYHWIRTEFSQDQFRISLNKLSQGINLLESFKEKDSFNYMLKIISELIDTNMSIIVPLIESKEFWQQVSKFQQSLNFYMDQQNEDFSGFLIKILKDPKLDLNILNKLVQRVYLNEQSLDYFDQLIVLMSGQQKENSNIFLAFDEIFRQKQIPLINFLKVIVGRVSYDELLLIKK